MKLTDLEAHSRCNNVRIYGIAEGAEKNNIHQFIENFVKKSWNSLKLNLEYKDAIDRSALDCPVRHSQGQWSCTFKSSKLKRWFCTLCGGKRKFSIATEGFTSIMTIQQKHWKKERSICRLGGFSEKREYGFKTPPPAKLRVFFESGPVTYAADDLKKRWFQIGDPS